MEVAASARTASTRFACPRGRGEKAVNGGGDALKGEILTWFGVDRRQGLEVEGSIDRGILPAMCLG